MQAKLPDGARDVLNLSAAHVSEDTIVSFIDSSAANYSLNASEIIHLRDQGVSDRVISAMLNHRPEVAEARARIAARTEAGTTEKPSSDRAKDMERETPPAQMTTAPAQTSTVYAAPSPPPVYYDHYGYYPCYRGYYGYPYPAWSFSFGFGSGYYGGGHHHGRSHGGSHGGGSHGGGRH
jgi:hypothetical protein